MTRSEMIRKLMELGYSAADSKEALYLTSLNFEEAKELLHLYTTSNMQITYELLKVLKAVKNLQKGIGE